EATRGETGRHRLPWHGEAMRALLLPGAPPGCPDGERVPDRCHASGAAVDVCSDAPAGAQRAAHAADGDVRDVSRALSVSPRAPGIHAPRVARCDPYHTRNCLPPKQ